MSCHRARDRCREDGHRARDRSRFERLRRIWRVGPCECVVTRCARQTPHSRAGSRAACRRPQPATHTATLRCSRSASAGLDASRTWFRPRARGSKITRARQAVGTADRTHDAGPMSDAEPTEGVAPATAANQSHASHRLRTMGGQMPGALAPEWCSCGAGTRIITRSP